MKCRHGWTLSEGPQNDSHYKNNSTTHLVRITYSLVEVCEMKHVSQYPPETDSEAVFRFVFRETNRRIQNHETTLPNAYFIGSEEQCWLWPGPALEHLPCNVDRLGIPIDPSGHEWGYNLARWFFPNGMGFIEELAWMMPMIQAEIETIIKDWDWCEVERDRYEGISHDVRMFLLLVTRYYVEPTDIKICIEQITYWSDYFQGALGCIDEDGNLDPEQAALNAMRCKQRIEQ